jgi:hypothetical protein
MTENRMGRYQSIKLLSVTSSAECNESTRQHMKENHMMNVRRKAGIIVTLIAMASLSLALTATPARAEPNPCAGRSDGGTNGRYWIPNSSGMVEIYGNWYNCSGGYGADRVKLIVKYGWDGPCITVPYGSTGFSSVANRDWGPDPRFDGWRRC